MDFIYWLKNLPPDAETHVWYPVGGLEDKNVKTGLISPSLQALIVPMKERNTATLPSHFLKPELIDVPGIGQCFRIMWSRDGDPVVFEFADDLLRTEGFIDDPVGRFVGKLNVWKDLLDRQGLMHLNKATGLWGELYICSQYPSLVPIWTGPSGSDIDFRSENIAFDVKTSRLKSSVTFSVSGLHQFDFPDKEVCVVWVRIETGTEHDESLSKLLAKIDRSRLLPSVDKKLDMMVNSLPYSVLNDLTFVCREIKVFQIKDLPIITSRVLNGVFGPKASMIKELTYQIDASGTPHTSLHYVLEKI
jgi:hypothetical protein